MTQAISSRRKYDIWHSGPSSNNDNLNEIILDPWHRNVLTLDSVHNNKTILEVGCGRGDFSILLSKQGARVKAMDFSLAAIEVARRKNLAKKTNINFVVADAQSIPFLDNVFDLIYSFECLEHILEPQLMLNECYRALKPNGKVVLTTENYSNAFAYVFLYYKLRRIPFDSGSGTQPIENFFVFWKVKKMLLKAGFKKIDFFGSHYVFLLLPRFDPSTFVKEQYKNKLLKFIFRPLARHMVYTGIKL